MYQVFQRIISFYRITTLPKDQLTDKPERFFVNETIREKILLNCRRFHTQLKSLPKFFWRWNIIRIRSLIMVERETQKELL
jgi:GTP-binding protein Era